VIYVNVPYQSDANLGRAYNSFMELFAADDWAVFLDHDAMPTTGRWFRQFEEAIAFIPDAGAFVSMANRCARAWQRTGFRDSNDMAQHRAFGDSLTRRRTLLDISETRGWAGVCFAVSKSAWQECGGFADGLGCVDHSLHYRLRDIGRKVYMIEGLYLFHWRHFGGTDPTELHPKAPNCPCMSRPDVIPTDRLSLP